jgi:hypothetical protein
MNFVLRRKTFGLLVAVLTASRFPMCPRPGTPRGVENG